VWQPRKLFFGGASGEVIATIPVNEPLPNGKMSGQIAAQALANHRSQAFGNFANAPWMQRPQRFTLAKSFVPIAGTESNLLHGLPVDGVKLTPVSFPKPTAGSMVTIEFVPRPAYANYLRWVKEQDIEHVAAQFRADLPIIAGEANDVQLQITSAGQMPADGTLEITTPAGWLVQPSSHRVKLAADVTNRIDVRVTPPVGSRTDAELRAVISAGGNKAEAVAKLHPLPITRVARVKTAPLLDGTDRGWEQASVLTVAPTNLVQGKVADEADSSARVHLAHDGRTLFVDVQVKDDAVVTNIASNDIKGHWRSDSVEICLDPIGGVEDTMGCYKLGIFPFDTSGIVRAARDADANQGLVEETAPGTRLVSHWTSDGYRIQAAIPFSEIGLALGQKRLGFNLIIYDGDKRDASLGENINKSRIAWASRSGVQGRPEDWGRIDLE